MKIVTHSVKKLDKPYQNVSKSQLGSPFFHIKLRYLETTPSKSGISVWLELLHFTDIQLLPSWAN